MWIEVQRVQGWDGATSVVVTTHEPERPQIGEPYIPSNISRGFRAWGLLYSTPRFFYQRADLLLDP